MYVVRSVLKTNLNVVNIIRIYMQLATLKPPHTVFTFTTFKSDNSMALDCKE